jgi:hypothetical protein
MESMPFHDGELEVQRRVGESERARSNGRAIAAEITRGALPFVAQQPFFVAATLDPLGRPWAWIIAGEPGFVRAPSSRELSVETARATLLPADFRADLEGDSRIGLLFFEPRTRRRLRVNGRARPTPDGLAIEVVQAFPNCSKYVQRRALSSARPPAGPALHSRGSGVPPELAERLRLTDTFFVASRGLDGELDVSHRGGPPGFVTLDVAGALRVPDYAGNSMFNTFGNLVRDPRAGLVLVDFEGGDVLQLLGRATLELGPPAAGNDQRVTGRTWTIAPEEWRLAGAQLPFRMLRLP